MSALSATPWPAALPVLSLLFLDALRYFLTDLVVLGSALRERFRAKPEPDLSTPRPLVSVLVAGHNEAGTILLTLRSLCQQTYDNLEIVVVDDGSTDGMASVVEAFCQNSPCVRQGRVSLRLVRLKARNGKAGALNVGLLLCRGDYVVYVDADTSFDRDAILEIVRPLILDPTVGAVGGNLMVRNPEEGLLSQVVALEYVYSIEVGRRFRSQVNLLHVISGAFGAFRKDLILAVGGHTPTSGNDGDLTLKMRRLGHRLVFAHKALCQTKSPSTLKGLIKQRRRWDRNLVKNKLRRHRDLLDPRSAGFSWSNVVLILDAIFFNILLSTRWLLALGYTAWVAPASLPLLVGISYLADLLLLSAQLAVAHTLHPRPLGVRLMRWLHLPLYPIYKMVFRVLRLYAYGEEVLRRASYRDTFAPAQVSKEALLYDQKGALSKGSLALSLLWPFTTRDRRSYAS